MMRIIGVLAFVSPALADPPSGYQCAPGSTNKGVGCTCPASHREKRDAENTALCAAKPTTSATQQLLALLAKTNLAAATELAQKFDFDNKTFTDALSMFAKWLAPIGEQVALLASRGQCNAVKKQLGMIEQWRAVFTTMVGKRYAGADFQDDVLSALDDQFDRVLSPLTANLETCIATASKDDGATQIKAAYEGAKPAIGQCFKELPDAKGPVTLRVVVDADGVVAETTFAATWPDLDVKLVNKRLEKTRLEEIRSRAQCFQTIAVGWKFKPNARGFAGTIPVGK